MDNENQTAEAKPEHSATDGGQTQTTTDQNGQSHAVPKPASEPADAAHTIGTGSGGTQQGNG